MPLPDEPRYRYTALNENNREIRLLEIHGPGADLFEIRCSILVTSLNNAPEYTALSYCWGDISNERTIWLDDANLLVTSNLFSALLELRTRPGVKQLWVDAICINQSNHFERNQQVPLMRDIYGGAKLTIVWLGEASENSGLAFRLIRAWSDARDNFEKFLQQCHFAFDAEMWKEVRQLAQRPWWSRVWVYQEYVVSKHVLFMCGTDLMHSGVFRGARQSWRDIPSIAERISHEDLRKALKPGTGHIDELDYQRMLYERRYIREQNNKQLEDITSMDLLGLIEFTASMEATNPRDKLYALLGVDDTRDVVVSVNYEDPVNKVYTDFAINYITTKSSLELLKVAGIGYSESHSQLPSWVPDLQTGNKRGQNLTNKLNCASGSYKRIHCIDADRQSLSVIGFVCDFIIANDSSHEVPWNSRHEKWAELALNSTRAHPTGISRVQAFFRTMIADDTRYGYGNPDFAHEEEREKFFNLAKGFMSYSGMISAKIYEGSPVLTEKFQKWEEKVRRNSRYAARLQCFLRLIPDEPVTKTDRELLEPFLQSINAYGELNWPYDTEPLTYDEELKFASRYVAHASEATGKKGFFISDKGYMGLGPALIENGDKICIIFGCPHPLLLRTRNMGKTFSLVGEAYVYGMMRGEMITELEARNFMEEEFDIL